MLVLCDNETGEELVREDYSKWCEKDNDISMLDYYGVNLSSGNLMKWNDDEQDLVEYVIKEWIIDVLQKKAINLVEYDIRKVNSNDIDLVVCRKHGNKIAVVFHHDHVANFISFYFHIGHGKMMQQHHDNNIKGLAHSYYKALISKNEIITQ